MRTKTLLLSAALGALTGASVMAQAVYSINAVGYINVTLPPGLSQVADQLYATNGQANYLSPILDSQLGNNPSFIGCQLYIYVQSSGSYAGWSITHASQAAYQANNAVAPEHNLTGVGATNYTINPGQAFWFYNTGATNLTLTFVGTVPSTNSTVAGLTNILTNPTNTLAGGLQMVSSIVPLAGQVDTVLGIAPSASDDVYIYENYGGGSAGYSSFSRTHAGTWRLLSGTNTAPVVNVGQGFWYLVSAANSTNTWVQEFGINE